MQATSTVCWVENVTIATQLKRLEKAFASLDQDLSSSLGIAAEDAATLHKVFSLTPAAFIDTWARALGPDRQRTDPDRARQFHQRDSRRHKPVEGHRRLHNRRRIRSTPLSSQSLAHDICRTPDRFVLIENMERFAPGDNAAFLRYTFQHICNREPRPAERLEFEFDLRRGHLDRRTAREADRCDRPPGRSSVAVDTMDAEERNSDPACARTMPAGLVYDDQGHQTLIFVRELREGGWMIAPDMMRQTPRMEEKNWLVHEGWLLTGPKRSFEPGCWRVDLDIVQPQDQILDIDVVANSGLDVLQKIEIAGPLTGGFCVNLRPATGSESSAFPYGSIPSRSGSSLATSRCSGSHDAVRRTSGKNVVSAGQQAENSSGAGLSGRAREQGPRRRRMGIGGQGITPPRSQPAPARK